MAAIAALLLSFVVAPSRAAALPVRGAWLSWGPQPCDPWEGTAVASAASYVRGWACPTAGFTARHGYTPTWVHHAGSWRVVDPTAGCTSAPDQGWYFDFRAACGVHDYCYDLGRERYANVWKADCDQLLYETAVQDCAVRQSWRSLCLDTAESYWRAVRVFGVWWFNPERWN